MFYKLKNNKLNDDSGFTLIELLIVITVLGILMSMAIPALSGVRNKADNAVAQSDLHNIMHSLEMYYIENGEYPSVTGDKLDTVSDLTDLNIKNDASFYSYKIDSSASEYLLYFQDQNDNYFYISTNISSLTGPQETEPSL